MADFDSSYDSGGETTGENSYDSVDISENGAEVDIDSSVESSVDVSGENSIEVTIPSGPEVGTEIDIANETETNSFISIGDSNIDNPGKVNIGDSNGDKPGEVSIDESSIGNPGEVSIDETNADINAIVNVDESNVSKSIEVNTEQDGKDAIGKNNFEGEEKINEYLDSLTEEEKGKQIEALGKMSIEERAVYAKNLENEPRITSTMKEVAQNNGAELQGLEYRIKTPSSTYEKMQEREDAMDIKDMNDIIRYTEIYSADKLAEGTNASLEDLKSRGFEVDRVKNTWDQENAAYRGINVVLKDPEGQTFELQFHTQESFDLKNGELHKLYEERRTMADDDPRAVEIDEKMTELSSKLERPKNIDEVKNI